MKTKTIGVGMIGCGGMGRYIAQELTKQYKQIEIRALCDPDPRSIAASRETLAPDARVYADYRALVRDPRIAWVMIASWNCYHRAHAVAALAAGKHVFCQKPLATTLADVLAIRRACAGSRRMFNMGFTLRYSPHYRKIRDLIAAGAIGKLISMEFNETLDFNHGGYIMGDWRRLTRNAGTHLLEKCCHDIDLANWMTDSLARRVASFGGLNFFVPANRHLARRLGRGPNGRRAYRTWGGPVDLDPFTKDKDIVDNQVAIIEYASGVRATFHANCNTGMPERRMYICGSTGTLRANVVEGRIEVRPIGWNPPTTVYRMAEGGHGGGDAVLCQELGLSMLNGRPPATGWEDGLTSAITCFGIDRAMQTGQVVDMRPLWKRAGITAR